MDMMTTKQRAAASANHAPPRRANAILARTMATLALLLGVAAVGVPDAAAGLCIAENPNSTIFIPRFRAPAKGKCRQYTGLVANGLPANGASGQACTTPDGSQVLLGLTAFIENFPKFFEATLPLPIGNPPVVLRRTSFSSQTAYVTAAWLCSAP